MSIEAERIFYVDGEFVPESAAKNSVTDHAFNWGDGLFDAFPCWEGKLHKVDAHLDRLYRGARALALTVPLDRAALRDVVIELVRRNGLRMALIKIVVSRGVRPAMGMDPRGCTPDGGDPAPPATSPGRPMVAPGRPAAPRAVRSGWSGDSRSRPRPCGARLRSASIRGSRP